MSRRPATPTPLQPRPLPARGLAALVLSLLGGCASFSPDGGMAPVQQVVRQQLGKEVPLVRQPADLAPLQPRVAALLTRPLDADAAVQLALLNNRGLQAQLQTLGIGEADLVQAGRLPNPGFSFGRSRRGDEVELERSLHLNLVRLLTLPISSQMEARRFEQTQALATAQVLSLAADTRKAWVMAVAAEESLRYTRQVMQAAEASAELARRMAAAGNFNKLQRAREQGFYADAALGVARATQARLASRERLTRLMGLWGAQTSFTLPERLPDLPAQPAEQPDIERQALAQRLDVQAGKRASEQTARNLGLTRSTRFINVLELGLSHNSSKEAPVQRGWELSVELPLFDWSGARVARAEAVYMQSLHQAAETAVNARSEVREAYGQMRHSWDIARHHRDELVPLRQQIAEENLLRYNGMLIGVFELLADARQQIGSVNAAIEALRDYWLAQADLDMALIGPPRPSRPGATSSAVAPAEAGGAH